MPVHPQSFTVTFSQTAMGLTASDTFEVDWADPCLSAILSLDSIPDYTMYVTDPSHTVNIVHSLTPAINCGDYSYTLQPDYGIYVVLDETAKTITFDAPTLAVFYTITTSPTPMTLTVASDLYPL